MSADNPPDVFDAARQIREIARTLSQESKHLTLSVLLVAAVIETATVARLHQKDPEKIPAEQWGEKASKLYVALAVACRRFLTEHTNGSQNGSSSASN